MRANCWAIEMPGLPWVPGASTRHPERFLSWFLDRYSLDWQRRWLEQNAKDGYTHVCLSVDDSMGPSDRSKIVNPAGDGPPGNDQSLQQFVDTCGRVGDWGFWRTVFLGSKAFQPKDQSVQQYLDRVMPVFEALIAARVVDEVVPGWEWNAWHIAGDVTIKIIKAIGQRAHASGVSCWLHFLPHYTSWFRDGEPRGRFGFWDDLGHDVDGLMYQAVSTWSQEEAQARYVDTLWQFGTQSWGHKFRAWELLACDQWDNDRPNEADGDMAGYLACCTVDDVRHTDAKVWGYGGGARRPDGSPL